MVKIDPRTKNEIIADLKERARSFTPEWNPDFSEPDVAAALALACAEMFEGTIKKINGLPLKYQLSFYNMMNADLLPGTPSQGYVSFGLSAEDAASAEVPQGTVLSSYGVDGEPVRYETQDDILVSSASIRKCFVVDDSRDHIGMYEDITKTPGTELFSLAPENLQTHVLHISHPYAFNIASKAEIAISFLQRGGLALRSNDIRMLTDKGAVTIEYCAGERGYIPFSQISEKNGSLVLVKSGDQPPVMTDTDGCQLRVTVKRIDDFRNFRYVNVKASPRGKDILPDSISDGNTELSLSAFFPFGERFQLFNEIYFGCDEVLDKCGAEVTMSFDLKFLRIPIENQLPDDEIQWKWVAKKSDFKERTSYELLISEVIWEYYNGYGWSRLFPDNSFSNVFNYTDGITSCFRSITFTVPEDISPVFAGAKEGHFIRARILKAENLYKLKGFYMSPHIRDLSFEYHYNDKGVNIDRMTACNCLETKEFDTRSEEEFFPFYTTGSENRMVCLGYSFPPDNGPLRTLWDIAENPLAKKPGLTWQYLSKSGWKNMNMADETRSLTSVGLTIFLDNHEFIKSRLFGEELYWIRIIDRDNCFGSGEYSYPLLRGVYQNSVRAVNVDSHKEEYFSINVYTENSSIELSSSGILDIELYVNEFQTITEAETESLTEQGRVKKVTDEAGILRELWVRWNEVSTFIDQDKNSRCYIADRSAGRISFGTGRKGMIPSASDTSNIHVIYTTGGGERTNALPGTINGMERSIGLVSSVNNPRSFYGGQDTETVYEALERNAVMLRTQGRVVTASDLEELSRCASGCIEKVRAFGGKNITGESERGAVTLVVLKTPEAEFSYVRDQLKSYLAPRMAGSIISSDQLYITQPTFIRINIKAELASESLNGIFELRRRIDSCLRECIDSYRGAKGSSDWMLGRMPDVHQIRSAILRIGQIAYIKSMYITTFLSGAGGLREVDAADIRRLPYILPECGENDISIVQI